MFSFLTVSSTVLQNVSSAAVRDLVGQELTGNSDFWIFVKKNSGYVIAIVGLVLIAFFTYLYFKTRTGDDASGKDHNKGKSNIYYDEETIEIGGADRNEIGNNNNDVMGDYEIDKGELCEVKCTLKVSDLSGIKDTLDPGKEGSDWSVFIKDFDKIKDNNLCLELYGNDGYGLLYDDSDGDRICLDNPEITSNKVKDFIFSMYKEGKLQNWDVNLGSTCRLDRKEYECLAENFYLDDIREDVEKSNAGEKNFLNFLEDLIGKKGETNPKKEFVELEYVESENYFYPLDKNGKRNENVGFSGNGVRASDFKDLFVKKYKQLKIEQKMKIDNKKEYVSKLKDTFLGGDEVNEKFLKKVKERQKVIIDFKDFPKKIEKEYFVQSNIYKRAGEGFKNFLVRLMDYQRSGSSAYEALGYFKDEDCFYYVDRYGGKLDDGGQNFGDNIGNQNFIGVRCVGDDYMVAFKDVFLKLAAINEKNNEYEKEQQSMRGLDNENNIFEE